MSPFGALVAQLDRVRGYEPRGQRFESSPVRFFMQIKIFPAGPIGTNVYLLICSKTKQAAIIDAPADCLDWIQSEIKQEGLNVKALLLTHSHWDHIAEAALIKKTLKIPVYVHPEDAGNVQHPGTDQLPLLFPISPCSVDGFLTDKQHLLIGNLDIEVIHTPGHSAGSVCFYLQKEHVLFSGDTLFEGTIGRINFPSSRPALMWSSLKKLAALPSETIVYPGHGDSTTIGQESWIQDPQKRFGNPIDG
ncbi:MAG: hypothetical protein RLZZ453_772 [Chlamydiota bacterium]